MDQRLVTIGTYLAVIVSLADQMTKSWVVHKVMAHPHVEPIWSFLNIVLSWNKGVTFGIMNGDHKYAPYVFVGIAGVILVILLNWLRHAGSVLEALALGFVIGGAIGNIIDRVRFGAVVDFIDFHIAEHHWYVFNLADSAIVCGVCLLLIEHLVSSRKKG